MIASHPVRRRTLLGAGLALPAGGVLAACTGGEGRPEPGAPDQVTYLTAFGQLGRDAFAWCAQQRQMFADRNIVVDIQPGSGTGKNLEVLLGGRAQFVLGDLTGLMIAYGNGQGGVSAVGAIHQTDVSTWVTLNRDIQSVQDLEGRTIGIPSGGVIEAIWPTYAALSGADPGKITIEDVAVQDAAGVLLSGGVDAVSQFAYGVGGIRAAAEGREVFVFLLNQVLTDLYGLVLATTDELIASNPDLVRRFTEALMEGLAWSMGQPQECAQIQTDATDGANLGPEIAGRELAAMVPYVQVGATPVGTLDEARVARMIGTLEGGGAIPAGITPRDVVAFEFVPGGEES